ncbi:D-alanyl-D-alanine carboxypeptidase/D-alanyl-D-alanine-endopeptidase (penicillin-binding protein 4) [Pontibacter ummariensis]|uniref:D-alanyl-D-alanine carboxypeptidase / D-alanyl-D-alanine-endopeptidase (Penicillin-binding protein 4) n=1 Tax=Pontibacter ummariensis TaxID=1610492 RepID=A0A239BDA4_9BACT|nr:D-alanyl-D-alanine carboxypeptidase [Pontibacter ummariensis]PRY16476.1 D-alanyl-D-alanine carboxypeptidase/D-alanyl-D-alanine-endopeptidase (penicillin-binding protein 4) [Pontibacter ummariensis]SNS05846.1 D-alanyl-D-alanine carboxypeptidase / D-alanyl-D-alanine-endopeptidase (penicillin-binding protein 4) [Pontibacter ummariensis]
MRLDALGSSLIRKSNFSCLLLSLGLLLVLGCSTQRQGLVATSATKPTPFGPADIERSVQASETLPQRFVGFALYDPELGKMVVAHNADKYFVPASNTKLFTFYACLKMLGDSIPALKYAVQGDSLLFWGTGDPTFTHMDLKNSLAYDFLKNRPEKLYYIEAPFASTPFAKNWGWDDYNYYYQPERSVFPVHGNIIKFTRRQEAPFKTTPAYFKPLVKTDTTASDQKQAFVREWRSNKLAFYPKYAKGGFAVEVPFITSPENTVALLADTLKRPVQLLKRAVPKEAAVFYGLPADTVYKRMLQVSDNLLAEQLMALCSGTISDTLSVEEGIRYATAHYLADLPDKPVWVDGSGLSTMNMFTPRSIIALLQKLLQERPAEELFPLMAAGGRPGTFRSIYKAEVPYVFGKSGTLSHVHNQSGYLITKSGKLLLFSFMNNNYGASTSDIRNEMVRIMTEVHEKY